MPLECPGRSQVTTVCHLSQTWVCFENKKGISKITLSLKLKQMHYFPELYGIHKGNFVSKNINYYRSFER
jgi:hypothetical protein